MSERQEFRWGQAWGGAVIAGALVFAVFFVSGFVTQAIPVIAMGLVMLLVVAGGVWLAARRGEREVAIGIAVGYAVLTLISGGQCTFFVEPQEQALVGLVGYPALMLVALVIGGIYSLIRRRQRTGEEEE